jgi:proline iminopeptidase
VTELVLRGIFLIRKQEIDWFYQRGASALFPDAWEKYLEPIPEEEQGDLLAAYHRRLTSDDPAVRQRAARAWSVWEGSTSCLVPNQDLIDKTAGDDFSLAFARIECHYFVHGAFLKGRELLANVDKIRGIPAVIVQGRYDVVCPMESAWALHRAWPEADFRVVATAGHSAGEPGNVHELIVATDRFRP